MITIVDYQMGNLRSVQKAIEKVGGRAVITGDPQAVRRAEKVILPGVGAFGDAIEHIRARRLMEPLQEFIRSGRPFLGVCLGLQLLFSKSYEDGEHAGLDVFPGKVVRFAVPRPLKVPHMGWNQLRFQDRAPILAGLADGANVYFVHSYYVVPDDPSLVAATTHYGTTFASIIWRDNVVATQFHPEKSQRAGLTLLGNFVRL